MDRSTTRLNGHQWFRTVRLPAEAESHRSAETSWECLVSKNQVVGSCQDQEQDSLAPVGFNTRPHTLTETSRPRTARAGQKQFGWIVDRVNDVYWREGPSCSCLITAARLDEIDCWLRAARSRPATSSGFLCTPAAPTPIWKPPATPNLHSPYSPHRILPLRCLYIVILPSPPIHADRSWGALHGVNYYFSDGQRDATFPHWMGTPAHFQDGFP